MTVEELESQRAKAQQKMDRITATLSELGVALEKTRQKIVELDAELKKRKRVKPAAKAVTISDHALLRYMERVCAVDVRKFESQLLGTVEPAVKALGHTIKVPLGSAKAIIKEGVVVTVV